MSTVQRHVYVSLNTCQMSGRLSRSYLSARYLPDAVFYSYSNDLEHIAFTKNALGTMITTFASFANHKT